TTAAYCLGTLLILPTAVLTAPLFPVPRLGSLTAWAVVFFQGLLGAVAHIWWYEAVHVVGPSQAAIFTNLQPIVGIVLAPLLLGGRRHAAGAGGCRPHHARTAHPEQRLLGELLHLGEDLVGLRELARAITLDEADRALLVHDEGRPAVGVPVGPVHAVVLRDGAVNVREQRIVADPDGLRPVVVAKRAVRTDTQHLGIRRLKVANAPVEGGHARASAGRPVERIEEDDHVLAAELSQADFPEPDGTEREVWRGIADIEGPVVAHSPNPPC